VVTHPPASAGRYTLGEEIARGGMGAVYRATDAVLGREVAVKVLHGEFGPDSGTASRFADEARIAAQLQHPAVPPVHDLGALPDGRPFLAMKLIKGQTLDALLAARPDPAADRGRFVAAFEQACQAIAYAHAHKVIHRDLKPQNVMVGAFGEVQVMDWGLAKVLGPRADEPIDPEATRGSTEVRGLRDSDGSFTRAGSVLGTPAYMPPEQAVGAVGKVDERSDVFGLGAILAVILTGRPPFASDSAETTRVKAAQGDVADCLARLDGCGAEPDLVALCKRCLNPRPVDRPADAGEVAKAVAALRAAADERARQAELDRVKAEGEKAAAEARAEAEAATRRAAAERAAERRKRRRVWLGAAAALALVAVGGLVAVLVVQRRANAELAGKNAELAAAADRERERFDLAMEAVGAFHTGAGEDVLLREKGFEKLREKLFADGGAFYRKLDGRLGESPDRRSRLALADGYARLGTAAMYAGTTGQALSYLGRAAELYEAVLAADPADRPARFGLGRALYLASRAHSKRKESDPGKRAAGRAAELARGLVADDATDPEARLLLVQSVEMMQNHVTDPAEIDRLLVELLPMAEKLVADYPGVIDYQVTLADAVSDQARRHYARGRFEETLQAYERAAELFSAAIKARPNDPEYRRKLVITLGNVALTYVNLGGRWADSLPVYDRQRKEAEALAADYPGVIDYQRTLAMCLGSKGVPLGYLGRNEEALTAFQAAADLLERLAERNPDRPDLASFFLWAAGNTGVTLRELGRLDAAVETQTRAIATLDRLAAARPDIRENQASRVAWWGKLGGSYRSAGRLADARAAGERGLELAESLAAGPAATPEDRVVLAEALDAAAWLNTAGGVYTRSVALRKRALEVRAGLLATDPQNKVYRQAHANALASLSEGFDYSGRTVEARTLLDQALAAYERLVADYPKDLSYPVQVGQVLRRLGSITENDGDPAGALKAYERSAVVVEEALSKRPGDAWTRESLAWSLMNLGRVRRAQGQAAEAESPLARAVELTTRLIAEQPRSDQAQAVHVFALRNLGTLRLAQGRSSEATAILRQAAAVGSVEGPASNALLQGRAGVESQLARAVRDDRALAATVGPAAAVALAEVHAARAVALLRRFSADGVGNARELRTNDAYAPLAGRPDYEALLAELDARAAAPSTPPEVAPPPRPVGARK
jgi:tetratricopeptide (TPR) repeat protein